MEEQSQNNKVVTPASHKGIWLKMIVINILISALASSVIFFIFVGSLSSKISVLEQKMGKLSSGVIVR